MFTEWMQFSPSYFSFTHSMGLYLSYQSSHFILHLIFHLQLNHCMGQIKKQMSLKWTMCMHIWCMYNVHVCEAVCIYFYSFSFIFAHVYRLHIHIHIYFMERMQVRMEYRKKMCKDESVYIVHVVHKSARYFLGNSMTWGRRRWRESKHSCSPETKK